MRVLIIVVIFFPTDMSNKNKKQSNACRFYTDSNDTIHIVTGPSITDRKKVHFTIRGDPAPLQRHRTRKNGRIYSPSSSTEKKFRSAVLELLKLNGLSEFPFFRSTEKVKLIVAFQLKHPKHRHQGTKGRMGGGVDNYVIFVMGAINGVVYGDYTQVVVLQAMKLYKMGDDNSVGSIEVGVEKLNESELPLLCREMFN